MYTIVQEKNAEHVTQLRHEVSERASHAEILQKENVRLKDEKKKLAKQFRQKKAEDQKKASLIETLRKENVKLKDEKEKLAKQLRKASDEISHSLLKVYKLLVIYIAVYYYQFCILWVVARVCTLGSRHMMLCRVGKLSSSYNCLVDAACHVASQLMLLASQLL